MNLSLDFLDREELEKFEKFINSPYFNTRPKIITLFKYLKNNENVKKEEAFSSVYVKEKYNDAKLRRLFSDFTAVLEKFLGYQNMEKWNDDYVPVKTLESLMEKELDKRFYFNYKHINRLYNKRFIKDAAYYRNLSQIELFNHYVSGSTKSLSRSIENTDLQFIFAKLHRFRDIMLSQTETTKNIGYKMYFWDEINEYINKNIAIIRKKHPNLFIIYLTVTAMLNKEDHSYIFELIKYLDQTEHRFNKKRLGYYYNYIASYYWMQINEGKTEFYENAFHLYKRMETKGLFRTERYIPHHVINNVVMAAASNNDYNWIEKFLISNRKRIEPDFAEDVFNLSMARICFNKTDFERALRYLNGISYRNSIYFYNSKILLAKIKYEQGDLNGIKYVVDSLRQYSKKKKTLVPLLVSNINMAVKYFRFLVKATSKGGIEVLKMKEFLDNEKKPVPSKDWFYKKLNSI